MAEIQDLLFEIGTEELPPKKIGDLVSVLANNLSKELAKAGLSHGDIKTFATPRRLAVLINALVAKQPDQQLELKGPPVNLAFAANGAPTIAAEKFAKTCGVAVDKLERITEKKGEFLFCKTTKVGQVTLQLLPEIIKQSLKGLPIPRLMRWGESKCSFVRPVHWVVLLYGKEIVHCEILEQKTSNQTYGHRFHYPEPITIPEPQQYEDLLLTQGYVIADVAKRREKIFEQINAAVKVGRVIVDEALLDEVTDLVEWPVVLTGIFDPHFLELPPEALITSLQHQQRCFPIVDAAGKLTSRFVLVSNIVSRDPARVIAGNERVIRARLTDAKFFYQNDVQFTLDSYLDRLKPTVFQAKLGSLYDKTLRLIKLAEFIASKISANVEHVKRAAQLAKCDLMASLVWEFPELQGIMGYYYALAQFEPEPVAIAIKEQYLPRFAKDQLPATKDGCALALADRIDNLVGLFGTNKIPTGEKDPLGLRRAALGLWRIIAEHKLDLDLVELIEFAKQNYQLVFENQQLALQLLDFIYERLRSWYLEQGGDVRVFNAVLARRPTKLLDFNKRLEAVQYFLTLPEAEALSMAHKRVTNILTKAQVTITNKFDVKHATEVAEKELASAITKLLPELHKLYAANDYQAVLGKLATLKPVIDTFFDKVMVMVDDTKVRTNRLALLQELHGLFIGVADIGICA